MRQNARPTGDMLALLVALLAAGCRDAPSAPQRLAGVYVLESVNDNPIPATAAQGGGQQYIMLADSLVFDLSGHVTRSYTVRWISTTPPVTDTIYSQTLTFPYSIDRNRLTIGTHQSCPANANCVGWDDGTIDGTTARVVDRIFWPGAPVFVYSHLNSGR
ncbi:MAG TPA: hypothetical protein VJO33_03415 [Gemmatimonadaceae bacterium]|nr:hypothetical protein [Gemmatimonadaceae bacterium]